MTQVGLRRAASQAAPPLHPPAQLGARVGEFSRGQAIGAYVVEELLGVGPTTSVFRVRDPQQKRPLALKILHDDVPPSCLQRLENEAATLTRVRHPGVVRLYGTGTHSGRAYLVREYLQGRSLQQLIEEQRQGSLRRLTPAELLSICRQLAEALEALHRSTPRTIHRNLMPAHVILVRPLRAVLVGFGLVLAGSAMSASRSDRGAGTPVRMSPEQLDGSMLDERTDVFSLGLVMYELATLHCPGGKGAVPPWIGQRVGWRPTRPTVHERTLPVALEDAILSCLEQDTLHRCRDAGALGKLLNVPKLDALLRWGQLPERRITDEPAFDTQRAAPRLQRPDDPGPVRRGAR